MPLLDGTDLVSVHRASCRCAATAGTAAGTFTSRSASSSTGLAPEGTAATEEGGAEEGGALSVAETLGATDGPGAGAADGPSALEQEQASKLAHKSAQGP